MVGKDTLNRVRSDIETEEDLSEPTPKSYDRMRGMLPLWKSLRYKTKLRSLKTPRGAHEGGSGLLSLIVVMPQITSTKNQLN